MSIVAAGIRSLDLGYLHTHTPTHPHTHTPPTHTHTHPHICMHPPVSTHPTTHTHTHTSSPLTCKKAAIFLLPLSNLSKICRLLNYPIPVAMVVKNSARPLQLELPTGGCVMIPYCAYWIQDMRKTSPSFRKDGGEEKYVLSFYCRVCM